VVNDDGFHYVDVECDDSKAISVLGRDGLDLRRSSLIADTGIGKDGIGKRVFVGMGRQFRLPFTLQMDTARQGMARRPTPSHGDCSLNFNFAIASLDGQDVGHVFVTVQPLDPLFSSGKVYFSLREPNQELKQVAERDIRDGNADYRLQVPGVSADSKLSWWCVVRGEPAQIERVRVAGPILPSVGIELEGKAGQVFVKRVVKDSPAEQAGLSDGELLLSVNGERVRDAGSAVAVFATAKIGDELSLEMKKGDKTRKVTVLAN
jgi:S1-C subfamily serine protease